MSGGNKLWWLLHVNCLFENAMKEGMFYIQLTKCPIFCNYNEYDDVHGSVFDNGTGKSH